MVASLWVQDLVHHPSGPSRQTYDDIPIQFFEQAYPYPVLIFEVPVGSVRFRTTPRRGSQPIDHQESSEPPSDPQNDTPDAQSDVTALPAESVFLFSDEALTWTNRHWRSLSCDRPLSDFLDQSSLDELSQWATDGSKTTTFTLLCGSPRIPLSLTKSHVEDPGRSHYIVLTAQIHGFEDASSGSTQSSDTTIGVGRGGEEVPSAPPPRPHEMSPQSDSSAAFSGETLAPDASPRGPSLVAGHEIKHDISELPRGMDPKVHEHLTGQYQISTTDLEVDSARTSCRELFNTMDWTDKPCGPPEAWSPSVRAMVDIAFDTVTADAVYIGTKPSNLVSVYNNNYGKFLDHPNTFGQLMSEVWKDVWFFFEAMVFKGKPMYQDFTLIPYLMDERGVWLEKYHSYSCHPIYDGAEIVGVYVAAMDWTTDVLTRRRSEVTRALADSIGIVRTRTDLFQATAEVLSTAPIEVPFFIGYSVVPLESSSSKTPTADTVKLSLESTVGVPSSHPSAPTSMMLDVPKMPKAPRSSTYVGGFAEEDAIEEESVTGSTNFTTAESIASGVSFASSRSSDRWPTVELDEGLWPIRLALMTRRCIRVEKIRDLIGDYPLRQWDELPDSALVIPLASDASFDMPSAVIIVGLNYHCATEDRAYANFIHNLRAHLTSALGPIIALENEIARSEEKEKMERAKTAWFRGAAHEFRSPLSLIAGPLEELSTSTAGMSPRQKEIVMLAHRNVTRLQRIVSSLLDFSRMEAGRFQARFCPTNLGEFVTDICSLFKPAMKHPQIAFNVEVEERAEQVPVDRVLMETALANLLSNAIKYTKRGSITVKLWYDDHANLSVVDTGIGIAPDEVDMVTHWFHRSQAAHASGIEGTGLGLGLAKEIIGLHNGQLLVESTVASGGLSSGSTFTARIPLAQDFVEEDVTPVAFGTYGRQVARDAIGWDRDETGSVGSQESAPSYGEGLQFQPTDLLLIVDDNKDIREYLKLIFQPFCRVLEAEDGLDALRVMEDEVPNLVLTDLLMPRMSGMDMLMEIRKNSDISHVPVILLSAAQDEESRVQGLLYGADDFLSKPFKPRELLARVHLHMEMGKSRLDLETKFHAREQELQVLSDACPSGIIRADHSGRVVYANPAFRDPAGIGADSPLDEWQDHLDTASAESFRFAWNDFIFGKRSETAIRWKWRSGKSMLGLFIRLDMVSGVSGIIGCITDVSYEEEKIEEAERRRAEAEESRRQQELIVDLTSHEIRTPVSAILQCASMVEENLRSRRDRLMNIGPKGLHPDPETLQEIEEDIRALESIYHCGVTQERIASDILSLARLQLGMLSVHHIPVDIRHEAEKVLRVFHSECKMSQIDLQLEFGPGFDSLGSVTISTDPVRFGQVVTNLVNNAVRFVSVAPERRITVRYDVSRTGPLDGCTTTPAASAPLQPGMAYGTPVWIYGEVADTGPGMTESEQSGIFERFQQGSKMIHTKYGGTGLGLFICKKIVGLLGGDIDAVSAPGQGSTFRFYIKSVVVPAEASPRPPLVRNLSAERPVAPPLESPLDEGRPPSRSRRDSVRSAGFGTLASVPEAGVSPPLLSPDAPSTTTERTSVSSTWTHSTERTSISSVSSVCSGSGALAGMAYTILVVEDNLVSQRVLQRQLTKLGNTVSVASNGQEALDALAAAGGEFDLVLMDLEMPIMGGLEAAAAIRRLQADGALPPQRIVALTGNAREEKVQQALESGMDNVMIKPYRLPKLVDMIHATVEATPGHTSATTAEAEAD